MDQTIQVFKALGDETRLKILIILSSKKICAKGIAKHLDISEAAVSQHIKILKEAKIIRGIKIGYYVYYDLQEPTLLDAIRFMEEIKNDHINSESLLNMEISYDCVASCKSNNNRCCQNKL